MKPATVYFCTDAAATPLCRKLLAASSAEAPDVTAPPCQPDEAGTNTAEMLPPRANAMAVSGAVQLDTS